MLALLEEAPLVPTHTKGPRMIVAVLHSSVCKTPVMVTLAVTFSYVFHCAGI